MTRVTRTGRLLGCTALAAGALTAVPAAADPPPDPVSGMVGQLLGQPSDGSQQHRSRRDLGYTHADDGVLRQGCHGHPYRYVVRVRTGDWTLETFLDDRTGDTIASGAFSGDSDPKRARETFRFCRYSTYPGRFRIRAKLSWYPDSGDRVRWLQPSYFRLRRS